MPTALRRAKAYYQYAFAITAWAMFERSVDIAVWIVFQVDLELAPSVTDHIQSVRSKLLIIEGVVEKRGGSDRDLRRLRKFRSSIEGITRERNRLVHDPHTVDRAGVLVAYRGVPAKDDAPDARFKDALKADPVTDDMLRDFTDRVNRLHDEYVALYGDVFVRVGLGPSVAALLPGRPAT